MKIFRRFSALILALIFLLAMLSGCRKPEDPVTPPPDSSDPTTSASGEEPTRQWVATDTAGVYTFASALERTEPATLSVSDGVLLLTFSEGGMATSSMDVVTLRLRDGGELGHLTLPDGAYTCGQLDGGGFYVLDGGAGLLSFYSPSAEKTGEKALPVKSFSGRLSLSRDGGLALFSDPKGGLMRLYDLNAGAYIPLAEEMYFNEILGHDGRAFLFTDMEGHLYRLDASGTPIDTEAARSSHLVGPYLVESFPKGYNVRLTTSPKVSFFLADTDREYAVSAAEGAFVSLVGDEGVRVYDLNGSRYTGVYPFSDIVSVCYADRRTVVVLCREESGYRFYLLDMDELAYEQTFAVDEDGTNAAYEALLGDLLVPPSGNEAVMAAVRKLREDYGVRAYFAFTEEGSESLYHKVDGVLAEEERLQWLTALDEYLALLPKGMVKEAADGGEMVTVLVPRVGEPGEPSNVSGYFTDLSGIPTVVMSCSGVKVYFKELAAHEFTHFFERHIDQNWLEQWDALSPADAFVMSYSGGISNKYVWYDAPNSETYFIDSYCRTYPTEDRAVVGEKLFISYANGELEQTFTYPNIRAKADLFCRMMRESFTSCKEADSLYWETVLPAAL